MVFRCSAILIVYPKIPKQWFEEPQKQLSGASSHYLTFTRASPLLPSQRVQCVDLNSRLEVGATTQFAKNLEHV